MMLIKSNSFTRLQQELETRTEEATVFCLHILLGLCLCSTAASFESGGILLYV